jgi:hypothetical protein
MEAVATTPVLDLIDAAPWAAEPLQQSIGTTLA